MVLVYIKEIMVFSILRAFRLTEMTQCFLLGFPNHIASNDLSSSSGFIVCSSFLVLCMCNVRLVNIYSKVRSQEQKSPHKYILIALLKIPSTLNNNLMLVESSKMIWYCIFLLSSHVGSYSQICLATVVAV